MPQKPALVTRILNCIPSRDIDKDWDFANAKSSGLAAAAGPLPTSADLRESWWQVGDQRDTGSCVGWAVADSVLRWHFAKLGRIKKTDRLSVRYLWMAAKETDPFVSRPTTFIEEEGTSIKTALDIVRKYGIVLDALVPFLKALLYRGDTSTFYAIAANLRITSYFNLNRDQHNWRTWLANSGPIVTRLNVDTTWDHATDTAGNLDIYRPETGRGGHAVALVGYTPDRFIVRNSWGEAWGKDGFGFASLEYARDAFTEAYGVHVV